MRNSKKNIVNLVLTIGLCLSIVQIFKAISLGEMNTVASFSAIIIAIIIAFFSTRIIWNLVDDQEANVTAYLEPDSQNIGMQLVVKNIGNCSVYDIKLNWTDSLVDSNGNEIKLPIVPELHKGDCVKVTVGSFTERFKKDGNDLIFKGKILFKVSKKNKEYTERQFEINLEQFRMKIKPAADVQEFQLKNSKPKKTIKEGNAALKVLIE